MEDRELGLAPDDVTGQHALPAFGGCQDSKDGGPEPCRPVVGPEPSGGVRRPARYRSDREVPELWNRQPRRRPVLQRVRDAPGSDRRRGRARSVPAQGAARQARGRPRGPSHGGRATRRHHAVLRRQGLDRDGRDPGRRGLGRDHERRVRTAHRAGLPLRGNPRPPDGRRDLRVLRRADRPRGRPPARGLGRSRHRLGDRRLQGAGAGPSAGWISTFGSASTPAP